MSLNSGETLQPFKPLNQLIYDSAGNLIGIQNDRANGSDLRIGGGSGVDGTFATLVATTALKLKSGATFDLYNTADQTTNYERLRANWSSNVACIYVQSAGSGTARDLSVGTAPYHHTYQQRTSASPLISATFASSVTSTLAAGINQLFSGTVTAASGTQTPVSIAPTINQSGTAGYTALDVNVTETGTGSGAKLLQRWAVGGTAQSHVSNTGVFAVTGLTSLGAIGFGASLGSTDLTFVRDAADTLALRRAANAQVFRVAQTYTDASNRRYLQLYFSGSQAIILNTGNGTAAGAGGLLLSSDSGGNMDLGVGGSAYWRVNGSGAHLFAVTDNTYDIGASGANRPRNVYIGGSTVIGAFHTVGVSTVATLPAAAGAARAQIFVSDSSVAAAGNFGAIVAGGGANIVPVYSDGTNWRIG